MQTSGIRRPMAHRMRCYFTILISSLLLLGCQWPTRVIYFYTPPNDEGGSGDTPPDDGGNDENPPPGDDGGGNPPPDDDPPPSNNRIVYFRDDGTREPVDLGYEVRRPDFGLATIEHRGGTRIITREGASGIGIYRKVTAPINRLHVGFSVQLTAQYRYPQTAEFADDFALATFEISFYSVSNQYLGTYLYYARPTHPRESSPPPYRVKPPEELFSRRQVFVRAASGSWLTGDIDLAEIIRTKFDPRDVTADLVSSIEIALSCQDVWGRGDECREQIVLDYVEIYSK